MSVLGYLMITKKMRRDERMYRRKKIAITLIGTAILSVVLYLSLLCISDIVIYVDSFHTGGDGLASMSQLHM